jgi:serine/threonine protein kinase
MELIKSLSIEDNIGTGGFAEVYLATACDGRSYAVKTMNKESTKEEDVRREIMAGGCLDHPNLVKYSSYFHDELNYYILFEYLEGNLIARSSKTDFIGEDLLSYISRRDYEPILENRACQLFSQLIDAVSYCHNNKVVHFDIKLDNIIYNEQTNQVTLIDFGLCDFFEDEDLFLQVGGTLQYSPPELLLRSDEESFSGTKVDVWGLGVVLYTMLTAHFPFNEEVS